MKLVLLLAIAVCCVADTPNNIFIDGVEYAPVLKEGLDPEGSQSFWIDVGISVVCVCCAALAAVLESNAEDCRTLQEKAELLEEKRYAERCLPLVKRHHLLLCTLLLTNSAANEMLPLFLDKIVPSWLAVVLSVSAVLIFGEILPSALFTGRLQLKISSALAPVVWAMMVLWFVLAWPIARLLDFFLGEEHMGRYNTAELKALMRLHSSDSDEDGEPTASNRKSSFHGLSREELSIVNGALELKHRTAKEAMIPMDKVFMLSLTDRLDENMMATMLGTGHSRIPVYDKMHHNMRGLLLVKKLIVLDPRDEREVGSLGLRYPICVSPDDSMIDILARFQEGKSHLAVVTDKPKVVQRSIHRGEDIPPNVHMAGIITLEDVLETLLHETISDETDVGVKHRMDMISLRRRRVQRLRALASAARSRISSPCIDKAIVKLHKEHIEDADREHETIIEASEEKTAAGGLASNEKTPLLE